jgi:hypothetical protein
MERVSGIEPPSSAWKADIITIIRYPHNEFSLINFLRFVKLFTIFNNIDKIKAKYK